MNPFQPNPFQPNIQLILSPEEEQFVLGQGGVNSGVDVSKFNPILENDDRITRHNLNAQRTYRNRYRDDYNKNMRTLFASKYGKDKDNVEKKIRNARMAVINTNYRNRLLTREDAVYSKSMMDKTLKQIFVDTTKKGKHPELDTVDGVALTDVFKESGRPNKNISKIIKDKGLTLQQYKKELKDKWFEREDVIKTARDAIKSNAVKKITNAINVFNAKIKEIKRNNSNYDFPSNIEPPKLTPAEAGRVYEKNEEGKRKAYKYAQVNYDGLQLYNDKQNKNDTPYLENRFIARESAPTNLLVLNDYYNNVLTTITPKDKILKTHRKKGSEDETITTGYNTNYALKRPDHRKLLTAYENKNI